MAWRQIKNKTAAAIENAEQLLDDHERGPAGVDYDPYEGEPIGSTDTLDDELFGDDLPCDGYVEHDITELTRAARGASAPAPVSATIGTTVRIEGELAGHEDIWVDGRVDGRITLRKNSLFVGPRGRIRAEIEAACVVVEGEVIGNITATDRVEVAACGSVVGDIKANRVVLIEGARFKGSVDMNTERPVPGAGLLGQHRVGAPDSPQGADAPTADAEAPFGPPAPAEGEKNAAPAKKSRKG